MIEPAFYRQELLVQGSKEIVTKLNYWRVPIHQSVRVADMDKYGYPETIEYTWCYVERKHEHITCHVCEGGHHVHVRWQ